MGRLVIPVLLAIVVSMIAFASASASHAVISGVVDVDGFALKGGTIEPGYLGSGAGIAYVQDSGSSDQFVGVLFSAEDAAPDGYYYFAFEEDVNNNDNSYGDGSSPVWGKRGHRLKDLINSEHAEL